MFFFYHFIYENMHGVLFYLFSIMEDVDENDDHPVVDLADIYDLNSAEHLFFFSWHRLIRFL